MELLIARSRVILIAAWLLLGLPNTAYAYLDPGTGSFALQMLAAGFLGAMLYVKTIWLHIKLFFSRVFQRNKTTEPIPAEDDNN